jgi:hypothetical protein
MRREDKSSRILRAISKFSWSGKTMVTTLSVNFLGNPFGASRPFYAGKEDRALLGSNLSALPGGVQGTGCPLISRFPCFLPWCPANAINPLPLPLGGGGEGGGGNV